MNDFESKTISDIIDKSIKDKIAAMKRTINDRDYSINSLKEQIKDLKYRGSILIESLIEIIETVKTLDDKSLLYISDDDMEAFDMPNKKAKGTI